MGFSLSHGKLLDVGQIGLTAQDLPSYDAGPIDLPSWFGLHRADRPMELEIGSGKGTFLVQRAAAQPDLNFVGLEYARAFWRYAADRCRRHDLDNVRLVCVEADLFVRNFVPNACLTQVHIYYPDPWPKKRHHKRRLIQTPFLLQLHRALKTAGRIQIATDHGDYFRWIAQQIDQVSDMFERLPFEGVSGSWEGERVGTNFERKYQREGRAFYGIILKRL